MQMLSLGVRLDVDAIAKLDRLGQSTGRTRAQVVRWLVDRAEEPGPTDEVLVGKDHAA